MRRAEGDDVSIAGVTGRVPVGAVLTIGTKGPSGAPTDRDRFYIKVPDSTEGERACHPSYGPYNTARCAGCVKEGKTDRNCPRCVSMRQTMRCVLVHANPADCFEWHRKAQKIMGGGFRNHPKLPACSGDGKRAKRLVMLSDGKAEYQDIPCPNDLCEFAQAPARGKPQCGPWMRLLFQPVWQSDKLPTPLMKFTSQSWHTISGLVGMFEHIAEQAAQLGVESPSLYGLPFEMVLVTKTDPVKKTSFPVVRFSPTVNLQAFLLSQQANRKMLSEAPQYVRLLDAPEQDPDVIDADRRAIEPTQPRC